MKEVEEVVILDPYGFIYITTNIINGKKYIGQKIFDNKFNNYLGSGKLLKQAIKKYGKKNFYREIIAITYNKNELNELEIEYICLHNAVNSKDYYNISHGGDSPMAGLYWSEEQKQGLSEAMKGHEVSEETKAKISESLKGEKHHNYGKIMSEEQKLKLSEVRMGVLHSKETREKISQSHIGITHSEESKQKMSISRKGVKMSEERKIKMGEQRKGKKHSEESKLKISMSKMILNLEQISEIREKYATGNYKKYELAEEYPVSSTVIGKIVTYKGIYKTI